VRCGCSLCVVGMEWESAWADQQMTFEMARISLGASIYRGPVTSHITEDKTAHAAMYIINSRAGSTSEQLAHYWTRRLQGVVLIPTFFAAGQVNACMRSECLHMQW
jgi:hypothetical protein